MEKMPNENTRTKEKSQFFSMALDLRNKKIFKIISSILIIFIVLIVLNYMARIAISVVNKIYSNENNMIIFQIVNILICLALDIICCYIAATLARKKNRNVLFWIFATFFANVFAILYLYKLPSLKREDK